MCIFFVNHNLMLWSRSILFWQIWRKFFARILEIFCSKSNYFSIKLQRTKTLYSQNIIFPESASWTSGHVERCSDHPAEKFPIIRRKKVFNLIKKFLNQNVPLEFKKIAVLTNLLKTVHSSSGSFSRKFWLLVWLSKSDVFFDQSS